MKELLVDQEILVLTVAGGMVEKDGKTIMDPDLYRDAYVGTAESVVNAIGLIPVYGRLFLQAHSMPMVMVVVPMKFPKR
ncbi:MAG: hypothetical protein Ct9H300mP4_03160 [Gammaproteobacteria bacterium]|nr:MAG: hypothetical protein Ct9H300mP4_03160 [Gammaproteobacteria bacterium]